VRCKILFALALLACHDVLHDPVAPPAAPLPTAPPRFDGVYVAEVPGEPPGANVLRFVEPGRVLGVSVPTMAGLEGAARLLVEEREPCARGTFAITDGVLRFTLTSKLGAVEYAGAIRDDALVVRWRSGINGVSREERHAFVRIVDDEPTPAKAEVDEPETPAPPETSALPEGSGWFCYRAGGTSRCERKLATCEAARKRSPRNEIKIGKCTRQPNAFCFTVSQKGTSRASCSLSAYDCESERAGVSAGDKPEDTLVSGCARQ